MKFIVTIPALGLAVLTCLPVPSPAQTTFLADYENGLDAVYAAGSPKAQYSVRMPKDGARLADGKFGKGLFLEKSVGAFGFGYETRSNFSHEHGTVEFWYKPEWSSDFKDPDEAAWLKPAAGSSFILFSTLDSPYGYRLHKNQYNYLSFYYSYSYKTYAEVGTVPLEKLFWRKGEWTYVAVAWDEHEGRLFLNGKLIACSDEWSVKTPWEDRFFLSGWGTFDDVRISSNKVYISSFAVPAAPLKVEKAIPPPPAPAITPQEEQALEAERTLFLADFRDGATARFAKGSSCALFNRPAEFEGVGADKVLRFRRTGAVPEVTLGYPARDQINPFLGTVEIVFRPASTNQEQAILFDVSDLYQQDAFSRRQGMRLVLKNAGMLEWQHLSQGRIVAAVDAPIALQTDAWNRVGFSWRASTITLLQGGQTIKQQVGVPLPCTLPAYFFIGSDSQGTTNSFDGWFRSVKIMRK